MLKDIIFYMMNNELNKSYLEEVLKLLLPHDNDDYLINYRIKQAGRITAQFNPQNLLINVSLDRIDNWLNVNTKDFSESFKIEDINMLKSFLFLFIITHEIEHSYEYLIGEGLINSPSKMIGKGYKGIYDLFLKSKSIIPNPLKETINHIALFLYKKNENILILERNANIEATDLLCSLASFIGREDIFRIFNDMRNIFMSIGYTENSKGSLEQTYQKIHLYSRYKKFYEDVNLPDEEKIKYGLNISDDTRQKLLKKCK